VEEQMTEKGLREAAEAKVQAHEAEVLRVKNEMGECQRTIAEGIETQKGEAERREDLLAHGNAEGAETARVAVMEAVARVNVATATLRGLARLLEELEAQRRPLALAALRAWHAELRSEEGAALAVLDDGRRRITPADCETYVRLARLRYGCAHDLQQLGDKSIGWPSWAARFELESRGFPIGEYAPSLLPHAVRDPIETPWAPLLRIFREATAA
jgi:hypothetical protein